MSESIPPSRRAAREPAGPEATAPTADVDAAAATTRIPGSPHFTYPPTAPVPLLAEGPVEGDAVEWEPQPAAPRAVVGPWALGLAIAALVAAVFVGWMIPLGVAAIVAAIVTLRRPVESRTVGVWALVLAGVSIVYSAGWLLWAVPQLPGV